MNEPQCWWTSKDVARFKATLQVTGPRKGWLGRWYLHFYSPAEGNIYGMDFNWKERVPAP